MREIGMSTRAIGSATGISHTEVGRSLRGGTNVPPDADPAPVTGTDGKTYSPRSRCSKSGRRRLIPRINPAMWDRPCFSFWRVLVYSFAFLVYGL